MREEIIKSNVAPEYIRVRLLGEDEYQVRIVIDIHGLPRARCSIKLADLKAAIERLESRETDFGCLAVRPFGTRGSIEIECEGGRSIPFCGEEMIDALIEAIQRAAGRAE